MLGGIIIGLLIGAAVAVIVVNHFRAPKLAPVDKEIPEAKDTYAERIALQWQNIAAYDGTERGQKDVET